jgi:hypothetical protein
MLPKKYNLDVISTFATVVLAILGMIGSIAFAYHRNEVEGELRDSEMKAEMYQQIAQMNGRIDVVASNQVATSERLTRIEDKQDKLLDFVRKIN